MSKPRRTETLPAEPLRTDDGGLLLSPPVCASCRCRPVRVVAYTNASGEKAYRASTSCEPCQRGAFGGGSAPAAPAVVEVAPISETRPATPKPVTPLTTGETVAALCQSLATVPAPAPVTAADLERHAVRMRRAGLAPVTRDTCDRHERRFFGLGGGR